MVRLKLTLAEQTFAMACGFLVARIHAEPDRDRLHIAVAADVAPHVDRSHPYLRPMLDHFEGLRRASGGTDIAFERGRLASAVAAFFEWRCGLAYDAYAASADGPDAGQAQAGAA